MQLFPKAFSQSSLLTTASAGLQWRSGTGEATVAYSLLPGHLYLLIWKVKRSCDLISPTSVFFFSFQFLIFYITQISIRTCQKHMRTLLMYGLYLEHCTCMWNEYLWSYGLTAWGFDTNKATCNSVFFYTCTCSWYSETSENRNFKNVIFSVFSTFQCWMQHSSITERSCRSVL